MATTQSSRPLVDGLFRLAGGLTRWRPRGGAAFLDGLFYPLLGNEFLAGVSLAWERRKLRGRKVPERLLVVCDIHIGDAVLLQTAVSALRDFFPKARVDYMVHRAVAPLLEGHPDVSELWPCFSGGRLPNEADREAVAGMSHDPDLILNLSPFLTDKDFPDPAKVLHFTSWAPAFLLNEREGREANHLSFQVHRFVHDLLGPLFPLRRSRPFEGPKLFLREGARREAELFLREEGLEEEGPLTFLNLDTASAYTRVPPRFLVPLLEGILRFPGRILLGEGHGVPALGARMRMVGVPPRERGRVHLVPKDLDLDTYAALLDHCDVFISGDTGPLHLAAARKVPRGGGPSFRNRTMVLSVFGATPPRYSGYDRSKPGFLSGGQAAPARAFRSESPCRNITCIHKMVKTCDAAGCFQGLDVEGILGAVGRGVLRARCPVGVG